MPRLVAPILAAGTLRACAQPVLDLPGGTILRPWEPADVPALVAAYDEPDIQHWHHRSMTADEASGWVAAAGARWRDETDADWAVVDAAGLLGRVALRDIGLEIGHAQVSYWTLPHARGLGIARRAAARAAAWALDEVGFWRLEARHSTANPASCRVAVGAGFAAEAHLRRAQLHADGWHDVHVHTRFPARRSR